VSTQSGPTFTKPGAKFDTYWKILPPNITKKFLTPML